jgi:hypothetical protein
MKLVKLNYQKNIIAHFKFKQTMKKLLLLLLFSTVSLLSFSQFRKTDKQNEKDKKYVVTVGTSKNTASYGADGFRIKTNDIRIVGFLHRGDRIEYKEVYIETKRDGIVIDSQILSCTGIHVKWRDFYLKFTDVVYSNSYIVTVYVNADRAVVLGNKVFFIKKDQD